MDGLGFEGSVAEFFGSLKDDPRFYTNDAVSFYVFMCKIEKHLKIYNKDIT